MRGGHDARGRDWPTMVSIGTTCDAHDSATGYQCDPKAVHTPLGRHECGGTLIAARWVLTAEHCTIGNDDVLVRPVDLRVVIGRTNLAKSGGRTVLVSRIVRYTKYSTDQENDVALLELTTPQPGPFQRLATSGDNDLAHGHRTLNLAGWGDTVDRPGGTDPVPTAVLQTAKLTTVDSRTCAANYATAQFGAFQQSRIVCTDNTHGRSIEPFDSGGPLVSSYSRGRLQVGIVSSNGPGVPDLFMRVSFYRPWIQKRVPEIGACALHASC